MTLDGMLGVSYPQAMTTNTTSRYLRSDAIAKPKVLSYSRECQRCGGSGVYAHYGVCFRCGGRTIDPTPHREWTYPASWTEDECTAHDTERRARNDARREAKEAKRQAAADAERAVWVAANPEVATRLTPDGDKLLIGRAVQDIGDAADVVPSSGDFDAAIGFHPRYLIDAINAVGSDEVTIELVDTLKPVIMRGSSILALLMPVRIAA